MMSNQLADTMVRALQAAGQRAARAATAAALAVLIERLARAAPDVATQIDGDGVRLRARGLWARAFGSRRKAPDPQLTDITGGGQ
jgi:hypothetical protein